MQDENQNLDLDSAELKARAVRRVELKMLPVELERRLTDAAYWQTKFDCAVSNLREAQANGNEAVIRKCGVAVIQIREIVKTIRRDAANISRRINSWNK